VRAFDASGRIMSEAQFRALLEWLSKHKTSGNLMFVVTPAILLPRRVSTANGDPSALRSDAWDGFPESLHRLLSHIVNERIENVVFLSGDEHHSCVAKIALTSLPAQPNAGTECKPIVVRSIHSSGLYTPFILANGTRASWPATRRSTSPIPCTRIASFGAKWKRNSWGPRWAGLP
jgi:cholesterol oxidase